MRALSDKAYLYGGQLGVFDLKKSPCMPTVNRFHLDRFCWQRSEKEERESLIEQSPKDRQSQLALIIMHTTPEKDGLVISEKDF